MQRKTWAMIAPMRGGLKKGHAVLLGDAGHTLAPYKGQGASLSLGRSDSIDSTALLELSRNGTRLSLCFSSRYIYSDIGDFSCVSRDATSAHIRSALDKIGLFKEDYRIAFTKIQDIDKLKGRYSYLAVPDSELSRADVVDETAAIVDTCCPIEASLASALATVEKNMAVLVHQDMRFIRIIAAKDAVIYYLITINAAESFDALSDTVSGIREITSLLMNSYQEKVRTIYMTGRGEIGRDDLERHTIDTEPLLLNSAGGGEATDPVLYGTALYPHYDFTSTRLKKTRAMVGYAKISMAVSLVMVVLAVLFAGLGWGNASKARELQGQFNAASIRNAEDLRKLEKDYALLSKELDLSNINTLVDAYKAFQSEPRLQGIIETVSSQVPESVFLTRISVKRPDAQNGSPPARVEPQAGSEARTTRVDSFKVAVDGVINTSYPRSKEIFSSFMTNMQGVYSVNGAAFRHKERHAEFSLDCEMKL